MNGSKAAPPAISNNSQRRFDWQTLVAQNKPGQVTPTQRNRVENLLRLLASLNKWANQSNIAATRAEVSAYTATVALSIPLNYETALLMAQYTLWAFDVDDYVDRKDYVRLNQTEPNGWLEYFDAQFGPIIRPLYKDGGLTLEQGQTYGLGQPEIQPTPAQPEITSLNLEIALQTIFEGLKTVWGCTGADFRLANFTRQAAQMLGMFRAELITNFAYRQNGTLPSLEDYLNRSKFSIGIHTVAAIVNGLESAPQLAWGNAQEALDSAAKIVRLANDLGSYQAELKEGKVNSLTILSPTSTNFNPIASSRQTIAEMTKAKESVQVRLEKEIGRFAHEIIQLADGPLTYWLQNTVAFAIAMYNQGNYIKPT